MDEPESTFDLFHASRGKGNEVFEKYVGNIYF
jgi:hypothetical protein